MYRVLLAAAAMVLFQARALAYTSTCVLDLSDSSWEGATVVIGHYSMGGYWAVCVNPDCETGTGTYFRNSGFVCYNANGQPYGGYNEPTLEVYLADGDETVYIADSTAVGGDDEGYMLRCDVGYPGV